MPELPDYLKGISQEAKDWLLSKPPAVQELACKYLPGQKVQMVDSGDILYVVGYGEYTDGSAGLILSDVDPGEDYELAVSPEHVVQVCGNCFQKAVDRATFGDAVQKMHAVPVCGHHN